MARYCVLPDVVDVSLGDVVFERHLLSADVKVDSTLLKYGVNPADVTLPQPFLTELARLYTLKIVYIENQNFVQNTSDKFLFFEKARMISDEISDLLGSLNRQTFITSITTPSFVDTDIYVAAI